MKSNLEKYLFELRRIEEHRTEGVEKEIRKIYKKVLKELKNYIGDLFIKYSEDGILDYSMLYRAGLDARFLDEVDLQLDQISIEERRLIRELVQETYQKCYDGMKTAVEKAAGNMELIKESLSVIEAARPEVIASMVNNPVQGLTLNERLEKKRRDVIYNIRQEISIGISNGDRYETIANRVAGSLEGDYKKSIRIVRTEAHRAREQGNHDGALNIDKALRQGRSGMIMTKTWKTMKDERVRPNRRYKTKKGWKNGKPGKYDHQKMDGVCIPVDERFELPSGAKTYAPGQSGVAGEDINCRCYLSYKLQKTAELQGKSIESDDESAIMKSGAISGARNPYGKAAEEHARKYYGLVRSMKTDVKRIAKTTGYSEREIQRIKNYIFMDEHDLGEGIRRRFDPDYMMGESWRRLTEGRPEPHDLTLLRHEIMERDLIKQGYSQDKAHCMTTEKYNYDKEASEFYGKIKKFKKE